MSIHTKKDIQLKLLDGIQCNKSTVPCTKFKFQNNF